MKRIVFFLVACVSAAVLMTSCEKEDEFFDETLLYGKWVSGTVYYKYLSDGNGSTWDTSDDVTEAEAQPFTWTLVQSDLTHIHIMQLEGSVPKTYKVTELTSTTLKYRDEKGGVSYSFTKVTK